LLSLGERGVIVGNRESKTTQVAPACKILSDTGAGDALLAGYIFAQTRFDSALEQIKFAVACAACTLEAKHAVNPQLTEQYVSTQFKTFLHFSNQTSATAEPER